MASSSVAYHLALARLAHPTMREAFSDYLASNRNIRAIFVGTRRTDPHGGQLSALQPTDGGWPPFMRVHPVIEWHYAEVWAVSEPACFNISNYSSSDSHLICKSLQEEPS